MQKSNRNFLIALSATVLFISTYYLLLPVLPLRMYDLGASEFEVGLVMGVFSVASLILRPITGQLVDRYGRRKLMLLGIAVYLVSPLCYLLAGYNLLSYIGAQIIYGLAVGAFTTAVTTYVTDIAPPGKVVRFIGLHSIAIISAKELAPALGLKLWYNINFTEIIMLAAVFALLSFFLVYPAGETAEFGETTTIRVPFLEVLKRPVTIIPTLTLFAGMISFGAITVMLPLFAIDRNLGDVSWFFIVHFCAVLFTRLVTGKLPDNYLSKLVFAAMLLISTALFGMSFVASTWELFIVALIYGLGYGALYPALSGMVAMYTPIGYRGSALGIFTMSFDLGVSLGAVLGGLSAFWGFALVYRLLTLLPLSGTVYFLFFYKQIQGEQ